MTAMFELELPAGALEADPALAFARPDIDWHVWQVLQPLTGTQTWTLSTVQGDPANWLYITTIQVDVRAARKYRAYQRAEAARRAVLALPWTPWDEGVVNRVDVLNGPFWLPDQTNSPRYVARYALYYHPARPPGNDIGREQR